MEENSRCPQNLQSLLKFCLKADDGGNLKDSNLDPKEAAEKAEWLKNFMAESCINIGQRTKENMDILVKVIDTKELQDNAVPALEELQDITEHIEYAKDFIKMGGLDLIKKLLELDMDLITIETAQLLGNTTQNDEACQLAAIESGLVELLLEKITVCESGNVVKKLVFAVSCCIKGRPQGIDRFKKGFGTKILLDCMVRGQGEAATKCAFVLFWLVKESESVESVFSENEFRILVETIYRLDDVKNGSMEFLLGIVATLPKERNSKFDKLIDNKFTSWLVSQKEKVQSETEFEEMVEYINHILACHQ